MNFSTAHLDQLQASGKIRGYNVAGEKPAKQGKYRNNKVLFNGILFDSKKELRRYLELRVLLVAGEIIGLELQKVFVLIDKNGSERKCVYKADFCYIEAATGKQVVEDVKSVATKSLSTYVMKRKLMLEKYGIEIKEK